MALRPQPPIRSTPRPMPSGSAPAGPGSVPDGPRELTRVSSWSPACGWVAFLLPLTLGVWHGTATHPWRGDEAFLGLLGAPPGLQGAVSSWLGQLLQLVPIGSLAGRATTLGALALGVTGALVFRLALDLLQSNGPAPRLNSLLASCAAVTASSSVPWLSEGTVLGGQAFAGALALGTLVAGLDAARRAAPRPPARIVLVSLLLTVTALESLWAALPVSLALLLALWQGGRLPCLRHVALFAGTATAVVVAVLAPAVVAAGSTTWQGGIGQRAAQAPAQEGVGDLTTLLSLESWLDEVGLLVLVAGVIGALWGLFQRSPRSLLAPLCVLWAFDLLLPGASPTELEPQGRVAAHLVALAAVACSAALGLQTLAVLARHAGLLGARPATVLLGVLTAAVTWAGAEDSTRILARRNLAALDVWTDEALASLPPRSLVVVSSPPLVRRLTAAVSSGRRPDLLVVPLPLLGRGSLATELLRLEPALGLLIRELSVSGRPGELALTALADVRPLFVEADPSWDRRLVAHLVPGPFLARFAPHALGRSDRRGALANHQARFERVAAAALLAGRPDPATWAMLTASSHQQIALLELLGDKEEAREVEERLRRLVDPAAGTPETPRLAAVR